MPTMETLVLERADNGVVTLTLNRPERKNAMNAAMFNELLAVFREVDASTTDRVLVITGAGDAFCSGADLSDRGSDTRHAMQRLHWVADIALALHRIPKPIIAKVNGVAVGAGMNLALGCDLIVASEQARFSEIFARRGLTIDFGGSWLLPRLVGMHRAKELALFADIISAKEAAEMGLVNRVVPAGELDAFVADWAKRLAAGPPIALGMTKRLLSNTFSMTMDEALEAEGMAQSVNSGTEDTAEAIRAFLDKREPKFKVVARASRSPRRPRARARPEAAGICRLTRAGSCGSARLS
jgi:2-(1,2-epoxy-1,2-dihydrophenyl)acetyl-CoA isomerase